MEQENQNLQDDAVETESSQAAHADENAAAPETDARTREELIAEVARLTTEAEDFKTRYLRAQADFDNFRRRSRQEKDEFAAYANVKLIEELLPVLDTFEMAMKTNAETDVKSLLTGVEMVFRQLTGALEKQGLSAIEAVGQPFDPNLHEGIMQVASDEYPSNTVVQELRKGYKVKDKVVRPSMVQVSQ
ncbi:molecular chaperone GrpE [Tumebacillus sp. BK434]|uniref:nucleotide exchange factor GrpE n=1 Tax=Tumebacillus sp. BK434 TaxID=2512169 RepID=UPI0010F0DAE3|nr:nucleotide exchange factor GrpE [Tumebacillus sp. BK434]TCP53306.1 molecular chaperone GrpE [Tumebacillus sp. BK434]